MATNRKRKSVAGPGGAFEQEIESTAEAYQVAGLAYIQKIDPPVKVLRQGKKTIVILKKNPYLDFVGCWHERGGRMLMFEVKKNEKLSLPIGEKVKDGISEEQLDSATMWAAAGAIVFFLWSRKGQTRFLTPAMCRASYNSGRKSIRWVDAHQVPQGPGFALIDFLAILRVLYPQPTNDNGK